MNPGICVLCRTLYKSTVYSWQHGAISSQVSVHMRQPAAYLSKVGWSEGATRHCCRQMKSGGGVLLVGLLQLCIGLVLLGTYEGFKVCACGLSGTCANHHSERTVRGGVQVAEAKRTKIVPAAAGKPPEAEPPCFLCTWPSDVTQALLCRQRTSLQHPDAGLSAQHHQ